MKHFLFISTLLLFMSCAKDPLSIDRGNPPVLTPPPLEEKWQLNVIVLPGVTNYPEWNMWIQASEMDSLPGGDRAFKFIDQYNGYSCNAHYRCNLLSWVSDGVWKGNTFTTDYYRENGPWMYLSNGDTLAYVDVFYRVQ